MSMMPNLANKGAQCAQSSEFVIARTAHFCMQNIQFKLETCMVPDIYSKGANLMANFFPKFFANIFELAVILSLVKSEKNYLWVNIYNKHYA